MTLVKRLFGKTRKSTTAVLQVPASRLLMWSNFDGHNTEVWVWWREDPWPFKLCRSYGEERWLDDTSNQESKP